MRNMDQPIKVLILEDSFTDAELIKRQLAVGKMNCEFQLATDRNSFLKALDEFSPVVILSDNSLPQFDATEALRITRGRQLLVPFILVTGTVSEEFAANIIKQGADDYILKDRMVRLPAAIQEAIRKRRAEKEIRDYKYALDQASIVAITDQRGIITYANENFCKISKYSVEELVGQDHRIINSGYHDASYIRYLWATIANGKIWRGEFRNRAKDGSLYWVDTTIIPLLNEKGKPYQYLSIRIDITEKKKAEQQLRAAHDRLSFHIEHAPLGFIELDKQLRVKHWSRRAEEIFGWTGEEFIALQKEGYSSVYEEDRPMSANIVEELISGKIERNSVQSRNYTKSGQVIWCEWFNSVLKNKKGEVETVLSLVQDITERKNAEEALRQSEMRLKEAQAIAHVSNWEIDLIQNIHTWSDEFYRIYRLDKNEVQPSAELFLAFMHPEDAEFAQMKMQEAFDTFVDSSFSFRFLLRDGTIRHGYTEWRFEFDAKGKPVRLYGILQDITEAKEAEEELKKSKERFQYATKATSDILWELNFETQEYLIHEGKEKFFSADTLIGWDLGVEGKYIVEEDREKVRHSFKEARMNVAQTRWNLEYRIYSPDNSVLFINNHAIFVRDENGKALKAIGAITDITEEKRLEAELLEQQRMEQIKITATALEAQERERNAIGIELHDNVNQILVGTKLLLSMVKTEIVKSKELIGSCMQNLQNAIEENRKIAHVLVGPDLTSEDLEDQLVKLTYNMLEPSGIKTVIDTKNFRESLLDNERKVAIYRIAQEQCANIVKYAKANAVNITLLTYKGYFKMSIFDDGKGMDAGKKTEGIGLRNIKGRLSIFDGAAEITTAPGKGFMLEITIPL